MTALTDVQPRQPQDPVKDHPGLGYVQETGEIWRAVVDSPYDLVLTPSAIVN